MEIKNLGIRGYQDSIFFCGFFFTHRLFSMSRVRTPAWADRADRRAVVGWPALDSEPAVERSFELEPLEPAFSGPFRRRSLAC